MRHAMRPDEAYGMVFSLDNVIVNTRTLQHKAWQKIAQEEGLELPSMERQIYDVCPERAITEVCTITCFIQEEILLPLSAVVCIFMCIYFVTVQRIRAPSAAPYPCHLLVLLKMFVLDLPIQAIIALHRSCNGHEIGVLLSGLRGEWLVHMWMSAVRAPTQWRAPGNGCRLWPLPKSPVLL